MAQRIVWHNLSWQKVVKIQKSDALEGLSEKEVQKRQDKFGYNQLPTEKPLKKLTIFLDQFRSPLIFILLGAGIVTLIFKEWTDSAVIWGAVFLNTFVGYFQENKTSQALKALKQIVVIKAHVIREGDEKEIESKDLVPGDIIILTPGNKVPADARIIESHNLKISEAPLTGEWLAAEKNNKSLPEKTPLADRDNMVYMGCVVEDGIGKAVVIGTGVKAEIGKIAVLVKETKDAKTPLQKKLAHFSKFIGIIIAIFATAIFVEGILTGNTVLDMFIMAVAVAVAAIPEGLPVAMTVILALGMQRILKKKGLVRKLLAAETLGSTSIICTDKTLTLTEGKMVVATVVTAQRKAIEIVDDWPAMRGKEATKDEIFAFTIATHCNEAYVENPQLPPSLWKLRGKPTDKAMLMAGAKMGLKKNELEAKLPKVDELPFKSQNKLLATLHKDKYKHILFVAGAPEEILAKSTSVRSGKRAVPLREKTRREFNQALKVLANKGLRVVAVAYNNQPDKLSYENLEELCENLIFVGLIGFKDPLRKEVKGAIQICRKAGMRPIIVTGDHPLTARAIAEELGINAKKGHIITGQELDKLSDAEFKKKIGDFNIYARSEPRHKLRIVETWQEKGEVVAMTGDGINDAPALKKADIGIAVGSGTDVAKEVADLILLPDSFNIIVAAVEEGRAIIDNIRKVMTYLLTDSFTELILIGVALIAQTFGYFPLPILAVQILWVNLVEDGLPNIALAFEPKEKDLMEQKPQQRDIPLFTKEMKSIVIIIGLTTDLILLGLFFWLWHHSRDVRYVQTMIFACLAIDSLFYVFSCKSLRRNLWHTNPFSNRLLIFAWLAGVAMLILALYLPLFQTLLKTVPLNINDWMIIFGLGFINLALIEFTKWHFITKKSFN